MQVLDRAGVGTLWSICKVKFALAGHTHSSITDGTMTVYSEINNEVNFGGSKKTDTIYFGYRAKDSKPIPSVFVFGSDTGTATLIAAKFKGALEGNASTASNASRVNGHTVNSDVPSGAKFTDTNTWRGIQDNLTSTSTSESLSANQGRVLKGLVDGKANSSHTHSWSQISGAPATATRWPSWVEVADKPYLKNWSETKSYIDSRLASSGGGIMIHSFNFTPQNKTLKLDESRDGIVLIRLSKSGFNSGDDENCVLDASEFMARKAGNSLIFIQTISYKFGVNIKTNDGGIQYTRTYGDNYSNGAGSSMSISLMSIHFGIVISEGGSNGSIAYYIGR